MNKNDPTTVLKRIFLCFTISLLLLTGCVPKVERINVNSGGGQSSGGVGNASISADGRYVAYRSVATDHVSAGDTNGFADVFVHDRKTGENSLASVSSDGSQSNSNSFNPKISANGRYVIFESPASNLVTGDTNDDYDVFVRDLISNTTTRVSISSNGSETHGDSFGGAISAEGRYIVFSSESTNLVSGDTNAVSDIFLHDQNTGTTSRVSLSSTGVQSNSDSGSSSISSDGRYITFDSQADNLVVGDTNGNNDIFVHDRNTGTTIRISVDSNGVQANDRSRNPVISADGSFVVFTSSASNLATGDTNDEDDIFVHDLRSSTTERVSLDSNGTQANGDSYYASISSDGQLIAFQSEADNLVSDDTNIKDDIFVHDRRTSATTRVSINIGGVQGNNRSEFPSLSADGRSITFESTATNLVADDTNGQDDIFLVSINTPPKQDFNADGRADILWRHAVSGQNYLYMMNGISITDSGDINTVTDPDWKIAGSGDFNADGKTDILWRHASAGYNYIYFMDGTNPVSYGLINIVDDLNWKVAGIGDFDGDTKADILWRHSATGENFIYFMDGTSIVGSGLVNTVDDLNWKIVGVGDFDGDRKNDILWRNSTTGYNYVYLMDGASVKSFIGINTVADQNWQVKGVNDFNDDGKADILWRHAASGDNFLYMMDANSIVSSGAVSRVSDLNWKIEKADDFNGDGKADILWRHATTGENHLYFMNANSVTSSGSVNVVPDLNWEIQ